MDNSELGNSATLTAIYSDTSAGEGKDETTLSHAAESSVEADETLEESVKVALHSISVVLRELSSFELLYRKERVVVEM